MARILILKSTDGHGNPVLLDARYRMPAAVTGEVTPAQALAGNYAKRRMPWRGLTINVESPAGTVRRGRGWETLMVYDYGEIAGSLGADGDPVDVYLGPYLHDAPMVFVVHQRRYGDWAKYDEDKCMLGWLSEAEARAAYLQQYDDDRFLGEVTAMPVDDFVKKVRQGGGGPLLLVAKAHVKAHARRLASGQVVQVNAHTDRRHTTLAPGQLALFTRHGEPMKPNPYKGKDPVKDTPDLFEHIDPPRAASPAAPPPAPEPAPTEPVKPAKPHPLERSRATMAEYQKDHDDAVAEGDTGTAEFMQHLLSTHREGHEALETAFAHFDKHGDGLELSHKDGRRHVIFLPDASNPGKYRYQMFDARGMMSHSTHDSPEEAVADAASSGYTVHNPGVLDKLASTEEWEEGMAINALIQAHGSGQFDYAEMMRRVKAVQGEFKARRDEREGKTAGAAAPAPATAAADESEGMAEAWAYMSTRGRRQAIEGSDAKGVMDRLGRLTSVGRKHADAKWGDLPEPIRQSVKTVVMLHRREMQKRAAAAAAQVAPLAAAPESGRPSATVPAKPQHVDEMEIGGVRMRAQRMEKPVPHWRAVVSDTGEMIERSAPSRGELWDKLQQDHRATGDDVRWRDQFKARREPAMAKALDFGTIAPTVLSFKAALLAGLVPQC